MQCFDLRRLQLIELQILKDITDFCDDNDIVYYLCGGTLLGAARHKGFIPWDDDVDIMMDLKNYKKFIKISKKINSKYFLQNYKTDRKVCYPWTKVMLNGTSLIQNGMQAYDIHQGVFIDIFMINGIARGRMRLKLQRKALKIKNDLLNKYYLLEVKNEKPALLARILPEFLRCSVISLMEFLSNIDVQKSTLCVDNEFCNFSMSKKYNSQDYATDNRVKLRFEDQDFFCPKSYMSYLCITYGEWEKIPPENEQVNHNNCIVDFDNDYKMYLKKT